MQNMGFGVYTAIHVSCNLCRCVNPLLLFLSVTLLHIVIVKVGLLGDTKPKVLITKHHSII